MSNRRLSSAVMEALETASLEELDMARRDRIDEVMKIDVQLAGGGRMDGGDFAMPFAEYMDWRRRAVGAKNALIREQLAIKAEIARRGGNKPKSEGSFWRSMGQVFLRSLQELENVDGLPKRAVDIMTETLELYESEVGQRKLAKADI